MSGEGVVAAARRCATPMARLTSAAALARGRAGTGAGLDAGLDARTRGGAAGARPARGRRRSTSTTPIIGITCRAVTVLDRPEPAADLPEPLRALVRAAAAGTPRAHQLELLAQARAGRSALLIAPTGAGKTLAGFLPSLVELSRTARTGQRRLHRSPSACGGGLGEGGRSHDRVPPTRPPRRRCALTTSPQAAGERTRSSSPPAATCAARAGCTRSTSRRSRRSRSTSRATSNAGRRDGAADPDRDPHRRHAGLEAAAPAPRSARHPARRRRSSWRCCSRRADAPFCSARCGASSSTNCIRW